MHLRNLESTQEARAALGATLTLSRATSRVHHNSIYARKITDELFRVTDELTLQVFNYK